MNCWNSKSTATSTEMSPNRNGGITRAPQNMAANGSADHSGPGLRSDIPEVIISPPPPDENAINTFLTLSSCRINESTPGQQYPLTPMGMNTPTGSPLLTPNMQQTFNRITPMHYTAPTPLPLSQFSPISHLNMHQAQIQTQAQMQAQTQAQMQAQMQTQMQTQMQMQRSHSGFGVPFQRNIQTNMINPNTSTNINNTPMMASLPQLPQSSQFYNQFQNNFSNNINPRSSSFNHTNSLANSFQTPRFAKSADNIPHRNYKNN